MATDHELIARTVHGYLEDWCSADAGRITADRLVKIDIADVCGDIASAVIHSAPCREDLGLIRTGDGWKRADTPWLPQ